MFPIRGLISKQSHKAPWVVYNKVSTEDLQNSQDNDKREKFEIIAAFPPYPTPARPDRSALFTM